MTIVSGVRFLSVDTTILGNAGLQGMAPPVGGAFGAPGYAQPSVAANGAMPHGYAPGAAQQLQPPVQQVMLGMARAMSRMRVVVDHRLRPVVT